MSEHDVVTLNANFQNWKKERASGLTDIEPFLYYTVEQITKRFNLTDEQMRYGITDDPNDGGIDAIYCLAGKNSVLIRDDIDIKIGSADAIRVMVFQVKSSTSSTGFNPDDIDKFAHFADDLLTLSGKDLTGKYHPKLLTIVETFKSKYLEVAHNFPRLLLEFYLVTRGDGDTLNIAAKDAEARLWKAVEKHRGTSAKTKDKDTLDFIPVETEKLLEYVRQRRQRSRVLKWSIQPMPLPGDAYVGLVGLKDFFTFLRDDQAPDKLDELIFESNVRGNQGKTSVNKLMRESLDVPKPPDFWQLNNGITITCARVDPIDAWNLQVHDAQIVNGLQTSRQIFGHFNDPKYSGANDSRLVVIKLIPVLDDTIRDAIIRATNNQNPMKASALRATDAKQRDIEDLFKMYELFYDRRPGFYKSTDPPKPIRSIVPLTEIVQAVLSLVLHRPDDARGRPGDYIREGKAGDAKYKLIFGTPKTGLPLVIYLKCVLIVRAVEDFLISQKTISSGDRHNLMFYVALHIVCELAKNATPIVDEILKIELTTITKSRLEASLGAVKALYEELTPADENPDIVAKGTELLARITKDLEAAHGAHGPTMIKKQKSQKIKTILQNTAIK